MHTTFLVFLTFSFLATYIGSVFAFVSHGDRKWYFIVPILWGSFSFIPFAFSFGKHWGAFAVATTAMAFLVAVMQIPIFGRCASWLVTRSRQKISNLWHTQWALLRPVLLPRIVANEKRRQEEAERADQEMRALREQQRRDEEKAARARRWEEQDRRYKELEAKRQRAERLAQEQAAQRELEVQKQAAKRKAEEEAERARLLERIKAGTKDIPPL